jgi:hypothetical protein
MMSGVTRRFAVGIVVAAVALLIWDYADRRHAKSVLQAHKAAIQARGEKLAVADLVPQPPLKAFRAGDELSMLSASLPPSAIFSKTPPATMRFVLPGKARVGWREPFLTGDKATNTWEDLAAEMARNEVVLGRIQRVLRESEIAQRLDYGLGFNILLPHLTKFKSIAQQLCCATQWALHEGRLDDAAGRLDSLLALAEAFRDDRLLISQLVRIAVAAIAFNNTWEALQADGWTDAQLAALQARWDSLEFLKRMSWAMEMERAMGLDFFGKVRNSDALYDQLIAGGAGGGPSWPSPPVSSGDLPEFVSGVVEHSLEATKEKSRIRLWRWRWSQTDEDTFLRVYDLMLELPGKINSGQTFAGARDALRRKEAALEAELGRSARKFMFSGMLAPPIGKAFDKAARMETQREMVLAAIALKRYQLREHHPPTGLDDLVPAFLTRGPRDFMDGQPLRYRLNPDGSWLLYSVGDNGVDDGGNPQPMKPAEGVRSFASGLDFVWPQPATAEEIAKQDEQARARSQPQTRMSLEMMRRYGLIPSSRAAGSKSSGSPDPQSPALPTNAVTPSSPQ